MDRTYISSLYADAQSFGDKTIKLCGWVRTLRDSKSFGFIELNDGSYFKNCQIVFDRDKIANYDEIARQNVGASLEIEGVVILTPERNQPFELHALKIEVCG